MEKIQEEKPCKLPCLMTLSNVKEKFAKIPFAHNWQSVDLTFLEDVIYTKKVMSYGLYNFLVDIGGSLGLWLGLSVLGLGNLAIELWMTLKNHWLNVSI